MGTDDVTTEKPLFTIFVANAACGPAAGCTSKQVSIAFRSCTACRKLTQYASKGAKDCSFVTAISRITRV